MLLIPCACVCVCVGEPVCAWADIVQLIGACWNLNAATVFLVMERCKCTLAEALRDAKTGRRKDFSFSSARLPVALGIARAMSFF